MHVHVTSWWSRPLRTRVWILVRGYRRGSRSAARPSDMSTTLAVSLHVLSLYVLSVHSLVALSTGCTLIYNYLLPILYCRSGRCGRIPLLCVLLFLVSLLSVLLWRTVRGVLPILPLLLVPRPQATRWIRSPLAPSASRPFSAKDPGVGGYWHMQLAWPARYK